MPAVDHTPLKRLALVVPEFRASGGRSGGLDAVAQFVLDSFTPDYGWTVHVASARMSRRAEESRKLLDPRSWWRPPQRRDGQVDGLPISYFGAELAELEYARYLPRPALTRYLDENDAVMVVAGSPAIVNVTRKTTRPVVAQIATFVREERTAIVRSERGMRRLLTMLMTRAVARLDERALRIPQAVLVENTHMQEECGSRGVPVHLIPPGVDCQRFQPAERGPRPGYILAVGRWYDPRKDLGTLLRAFARARQVGHVRQKLLLAGLKTPTTEDHQLIRALKLEDFVEVHANVPLDELAGLYAAADLFALTSTEEGLGLVFLEAMASGTPVLATATMGARYALGDSGAGQLIDFGPDLVERFATALTDWCEDAHRRTEAGIAGRINVEQRFDAREAGARFRAVVEKCLP